MKKFFTQLRSSIFLKVFLVSTLTGVFILVSLFAGLPRIARPHFDGHFHENAEQYAEYLIADFAKDTDFKKAGELARKLGLMIRIEGEGWNWSSSPDAPAIRDLPPHPPFGKGIKGTGMRRAHRPPFFFPGPSPMMGPHIVVEHVFKKGPAKVLIMSALRPGFQLNYVAIALLIGVILIFLSLSYLAIRRLLRPIHSLSAGVNEISRGNLDYQVPKETSDELGHLAGAFNHMVSRVKQMIHSKQQLLVDVSHELRSPLTRAKIGLELMERNEIVDKVASDLTELEQMIEELLETARMDHGDQLLREPLDLVRLCQDIATRYADLGKRVYFESSLKELDVSLDWMRMKSVLRNLIENALKYSPEDRPVKVTLGTSAEKVLIEVQDQGIGIPPEETARVFEPFYRVDKSRTRKTGGFGLGLSLCKKIIEAHGGVISLKSGQGNGTTVSILLPLK